MDQQITMHPMSTVSWVFNDPPSHKVWDMYGIITSPNGSVRYLTGPKYCVHKQVS